ncbi:MAG: transporter substrate-binding domain-containing protein [Deltaproteobacteria bacterium]|nr:transporter substrate-binding domain-containing protein [Deltaproteobacteria bacterium]
MKGEKGEKRSETHRSFFRLMLFTLLFFLCGMPRLSQAKSLSAAEQDWLADKGEIIFVSQSDYPPFEFIDADQSRAGMCIELVRWIATEFGFKARFRDMSFQEAQQAILMGEADVITSLFYSAKRDQEFDFTVETWTVPALIFVSAERPDITGLSDLKGKRIAMQRGDYAQEFLDDNGMEYTLLSTATFAEAVDEIVSHKADAVVGDMQIVLYHLFKNNLYSRIKSVGEPLYTGRNCMGMREGASQLQSILNKGIKLARERGIFSTINRKWTGTRYDQQPSWLERYLSLILAVLGGLVVLAIVVLAWNRQLRRTVLNKTAQLSQSETHLRTLIETIPDMIWLKDPDGVYLSCNARFERFYGALESEIVGKTDYDFVDKEVADAFRNYDRAATAAGKSCINEEEVVFADDGHKELLETIKTPMYSHEGKFVGVLGIARDISARKRAEEEFLKVSKLESVGILAGGIAHDFNNILAAILGNISLALATTDPRAEVYELLVNSEKASLRAKDLTQQLLTFSKGGEPVKKIALIDTVIRDSAGFVLRGSNVRCDFNFGADLWPVNIDSGQISQVIQNIIINANQAMPTGGIIVVECANCALKANEISSVTPGNYIKIVIKDQGVGIPAGMLDKVFDPYFTTKQQGSGLGLAITHSIIRKHSGYITVDSKEGRGTTFTIYLPAAQGKPELVRKEVIGTSATAHGRIVIMDDEEIIRELVEKTLSLVGYQVLSAADGDEAIALYREAMATGAPIDLLIMDLTVPGGMGGKDAVQEILKINPQAKVIVSSGYSNDPVMADCHKYGFCGAMAKPFQIHELVDVVGKALSR